MSKKAIFFKLNTISKYNQGLINSQVIFIMIGKLRLFRLWTFFVLIHNVISSDQPKLYRINYMYVVPGVLDQYGGGNPKVIPNDESDHQKWWVEEAENGWYYIRSYRSNKVLDSSATGQVLTVTAFGLHYHHQHWTFQPAELVLTNRESNSRIYGFHIKNRVTGRFLSKMVWGDNALTNKRTMTALGLDDSVWQLQQITPPNTRVTPSPSLPTRPKSRFPQCPQMDETIGNSNGKLTDRDSFFSLTCIKIKFGKLDSGMVRIGAQCQDNSNQYKYSFIDINKFHECIK